MTCLVSDYLVPRAGSLRSAQPRLALELIGGNRNLRLGRREADLAIRLARPAEGPLVTTKLADCGFAVYALRGTVDPGDPVLWGAKDWVGYDDRLLHVPEMQWLLGIATERQLMIRSNGLRAVVQAVASGLGLGILPCFLADSRPDLQRLSGPEPVLTRELWLLTHAEMRDVPRIRAVSDWLLTIVKEDAACLSGDLSASD